MATVERLACVTWAVLPSYYAHGLQTLKMCEAFAQAGPEVDVLYQRIRNNPDGRPEDVGSYYNVAHPRLRFRPQWSLGGMFGAGRRPWQLALRFISSLPSFLWYLVRHCKGPGCVVFIRQRQALPWLLALRCWLGFRLVYETHSVPSGKLELAACQGLDAQVTISDWIRAQYQALGASTDRMLVVHDGFDPKEFAACPSQAVAREQLGIGADEFVIGYIGRFTLAGQDKGLRSLVAAVAALSDPQVRLCLVGDTAAEAEALAAYAAERGLQPPQFDYRGRADRQHLLTVLAAFDVAVNPLPDTPHNQGASPLKLFEYMAADNAIVATALKGTMEVLQHERNALLVEPGNVTSLTNALRRLRDEPQLRARLGTAARDEVQGYTWERRAARILEFVQNQPPINSSTRPE